MGVLESWFGPSRSAIWSELARAMGGRYERGDWLHGDVVEVDHGPWTVTLDAEFNAATKSTHSRLRTFLPNPADFRFSISRAGLFTELAKSLGMQDVTVGQAPFDREFVIQGNDADKLVLLFSSVALRERLHAEPRVHLDLRPARAAPAHSKRADATHELRFIAGSTLKDAAHLERLFDLMAETLDQLGRLGVARGRNISPGFE